MTSIQLKERSPAAVCPHRPPAHVDEQAEATAAIFKAPSDPARVRW